MTPAVAGLLGCAAVTVMLAGVAGAAGPNYSPADIAPSPDVYTALALHPELRPLYGPRVSGQFRALTVVGDSYADFGNAVRAFASLGVNPALTGANPQTGRFGNYLNSIDALQFHYAISTANITNYAVGGAGNGTINNESAAAAALTVLPGISQEIDALAASGRRFGPDDLVVYTTTGGNDALMGIPIAVSTANLIANVRRLISLGAQTIVLTGTGSRAYNTSQEVALRRFANSSTRVFYFDLLALETQASLYPAAYGFANVTTICRPTPVSTPCSPTLNGQNQFLMWDGIHVTTSANAYIGAYEANVVSAPNTISAQSELGLLGVSAFPRSLLNRLDNYRDKSGIDDASSSRSPLSLFIDGSYQSGNRSDREFAFGYNYGISAVVVGGEYRPNPNTLFGLAYGYLRPKASLNQGQGNIDIDSYQFAGFALLDYPSWFAKGVASGGINDYRISRPGVISNIKADAQGNGVFAGFETGYMFDIMPFRLGPIGGLAYADNSIASYVESGDPLLTQAVGSQNLDSFVGSLGAEARFPHALGPVNTISRLTLTANHEFLDGNQTVQTTQTSTPGLPVSTPVPGRGTFTYGNVALGLSAAMPNGFSAQLTGYSTFGRSGGDDYGVIGGLRYVF